MQNIDTLVNLIKAVKNYPKIFTNLEESDDDLNNWTNVAQECGIDITEAKDQWNLLLIEYVEYLKNNQDFELAHHMDFLQTYFFTIKDSEIINEHELLKAIDSKPFKEMNVSCLTKNDCKNRKMSTESEKNIKTEQPQRTRFSSSTVIENPNLKATSESNASVPDSSFTNLSSLELIFLGYAKQLQKMPLSLQLKTKRKIADIMDEAELQMIT